ncbi:MAG TPA: XdhC family protein [Thermoanaerobaculia bacterium]|jgi:xanthine/CO dehydrogenase XdhC/CoxF family maturation factor
MHEIDRILTAIRTIERGVVVTVIRTAGSTYRRAGARAVISESGQAFGAISGGCLEKDLAERIRPWLADMQARVISYDSTRPSDVVFGLGLGCRGILDLLVEPFDSAHPPRIAAFQWNRREPVEWTTVLPDGETMLELIRPRRALVVFGGGADVEPVVRLAEQIGWRADVVTTREPVDLTEYDAAVVMTHNFQRDAELLPRLVQSQLAYIGLLGPKSRGEELFAETGVPRDARVHSPIGLDLGSETPDEIALSIVAEIQAVLNRRSGRALRDLNAPIHEPLAAPETCV